MRKKNFLITIFLSALSLIYTCCESDSSRISNELIGTWRIDSISASPARKLIKNNEGQWVEDCSQNKKTQSGEFEKVEPCKTLIFHNTTDYSQLLNCGDVHQNFTGKYYVLSNPKRGLTTLVLIPDIDVSNGDTIRVGYTNMDIITIHKDRLVLVSETQWSKSDCFPQISFNKRYLYQRIK